MLTLHLTEDEAETLRWGLWYAVNSLEKGQPQTELFAEFRRQQIDNINALRQRVIDSESVPSFAAHIDIE